MLPEKINRLDWNKQGGLLPAIVQDAANGRVLMLGYMSREALEATIETGHVTFWSRSKDRLWTKGETSGNTLALVRIETDCDHDSLLVLARPDGPTCHEGRASCFAEAPSDFLADLDALIRDRHRDRPPGSYTTQLFESGAKGIAQKVGEEGVETAIAAVVEDDASLLSESADLMYHLIVLLRSRGLSLDSAIEVMKDRHRLRSQEISA